MASESTVSQRFFVLETGGPSSRYDVDVDKTEPVNRGEPPRCPKCGGIIGLLTWLPPFRAELELYGDGVGDYIRGMGYERLISERFADAFREAGLTGLNGFHPVDISRVRFMRKRSRNPPAIPRYFVVWPCFGQASVDLVLNRVGFSKPPTCTQCRSTGIDTVHGFVLDPGSWGGEDIFRPRGLQGDIVVSERFKEFVERHGLTNMKLTPTEQFVSDPSKRGPPPLPTA